MLLMACGPYNQYQQTKTIANMRAITTRIDELRSRKGVLTENDVRSEVIRVGGGTDAWGTKLTYAIRRSANGDSYLLISAGSDRKFDVADPGVYFETEPREVWTDPARDLVFRNGELITLAGK